MLNLDKIYQAAYKIKNVARKTDMIKAYNIIKDESIYLKTENLQTTGSFKLRGAYFKISSLTDEEKKKGIIACSAGNHAQGVALSGKRFGIKTVIFMPKCAPISKIEATKSYGATVILEGDTFDDAYKACMEYKKVNDMTLIHPFDDEYVISGQATIGLEILEQLPDVDNVFVPIGGGGLISGISYAIKQLKPEVKIIGVEPENASSMKQSILNDHVSTIEAVNTFADGIAVKTPGELTYKITKGYVDEIVTVSEEEIATSILTLMEKQKLVCEGAGATSMAPILFDKYPYRGKVNCCVLSGGNIDVNILSKVISRGLMKQGRMIDLKLGIIDRPGEMMKVLNVIYNLNANVKEIHYDQAEENTAIESTIVTIIIETRDNDHINAIIDALKKKHYNVYTDGKIMCRY